jgi:two-component system cell cycle sensor histidine kinase/response regulator CckA
MKGFLAMLLGNGIGLDMETCPEACHIRCERGQFQAIILNLTQNSKEAMPNGGMITIRTRNVHAERGGFRRNEEGKSYVVLTIRDTGIGITPDDIDRIFDPYFTTKDISKTPGVGLGLSSALGIVRQCGGFIRVQSKPAAGATFNIFFPMAPPG